MSIQHGFAANAGLGAPENNAPSSADGSSIQSAFDPNTGERVPGYQPPKVVQRQSPVGGVGDSETGLADAASFRRTEAQFGGISDDCDSNCNAAGYALPNGAPDHFHTVGSILENSNLQSTTVVGGPGADHEMVRRTGGGDDPFVWPYGAGGTSIA
jgi:hypothetical protein